ncbi:hypothetical protein BT69DRAFT_1352888 [Atractiella rhizophila]|nr:hypothetical protein BT69DRAFT_1352888 [Atractiella rhizophila]
MPPIKFSAQSIGAHYGRKDISILCATNVQKLFGESSTPQCSLEQWVAHILHNMDIPNNTVFRALHLLQLLSASFGPSPTPQLHERLLLSCLIIASSYSSTPNSAADLQLWRIACRNMFTVEEIRDMEDDLFQCLEHHLMDGGEGLAIVAREEERIWNDVMRSRNTRDEKIGRMIEQANRNVLW